MLLNYVYIYIFKYTVYLEIELIESILKTKVSGSSPTVCLICTSKPLRKLMHSPPSR